MVDLENVGNTGVVCTFCKVDSVKCEVYQWPCAYNR